MLQRTLRVKSIRSQSPKSFGGCIFTGKPIDADGNVQDAAAYYVVKATGLTLGNALVQPGQCWTVCPGKLLRCKAQSTGIKGTHSH